MCGSHTVLPRWSNDAAQTCVKIRKPAVEAELEALLNCRRKPPDANWLDCNLVSQSDPCP